MARRKSRLLARLAAGAKPYLTARNAVIVLVAAAVAGLAGAQAYVLSVRASQPALALAIDPGEPIALARLARRHLLVDPKNRAEAEKAALESLDRLLLNPTALYILGTREDAAARLGEPSRMSVLVEKLSRRVPENQLRLLDLAMRRKDLAGALAQLDRLLRYRASVSDQVFPLLTRALPDPLTRQALHDPLLKAPWAGRFLDHAAEYGDAREVAKLFAAIPPEAIKAKHEAAQAKVIDKLVAAGDPHGALAMYRRLGFQQAGQGNLVDRSAFDARYVPFTWQLFTNDDVFSRLAGNNGGLAIAMAPDRQALAARRLVFLPSGRHSIAWQAADEESRLTLRPTLNCFRPGNGSLRIDTDEVASSMSGPTSATIVVPGSCPVQYLNLVVSTDEVRQVPDLLLTSLRID